MVGNYSSFSATLLTMKEKGKRAELLAGPIPLEE